MKYLIPLGYDIVKIFTRVFSDFVFVGNTHEVSHAKTHHPTITSMTYEEFKGKTFETTVLMSTLVDDYKEVVTDKSILIVFKGDFDYKIRSPIRTVNHLNHLVLPTGNVLVLTHGPLPDIPSLNIVHLKPDMEVEEQTNTMFVMKQSLWGMELPNIQTVVTYYDCHPEGFLTCQGAGTIIHIGNKPLKQYEFLPDFYEYKGKNKQRSKLLKTFEPSIVDFLLNLSSITSKDLKLAKLIQNHRGISNDVRELEGYDYQRHDQAIIDAYSDQRSILKGMDYMMGDSPMMSTVLNSDEIYVIKSYDGIITLGLGIWYEEKSSE